ncbi:hypothetical protein BDY19DRAFT_905349 [Irpex rosettiformis]|uniref:Uncharacterized protein n=1 Tax=Irpex rosettiformis TaxID=378272 RepID=A0ACB8U7N3_9APHY|nr:hypothetical protein BDY19DRAFT_905349 [Irpex rosettiformis]
MAPILPTDTSTDVEQAEVSVTVIVQQTGTVQAAVTTAGAAAINAIEAADIASDDDSSEGSSSQCLEPADSEESTKDNESSTEMSDLDPKLTPAMRRLIHDMRYSGIQARAPPNKSRVTSKKNKTNPLDKLPQKKPEKDSKQTPAKSVNPTDAQAGPQVKKISKQTPAKSVNSTDAQASPQVKKSSK